MIKQFKLIFLTVGLAFLLIGGLFASMQVASADYVEGKNDTVHLTQEILEVGLVPTALTLDVPDIGMEYNTSKTIDLAMYTTYDGSSVLTYTSESSFAWLDYTILGTTMVVTSGRSVNENFVMTIVVSDGLVTATDTFSIYANFRPEFGNLPSHIVYAGLTYNNVVSLTHKDYAGYTYPEEDYPDKLSYSFVETPPAAVGASIDAGRYLDLAPPASPDSGRYHLNIQVEDTSGLTATAWYTVSIIGDALQVAVPDFPLARNESKMIDLWDYSTYNGGSMLADIIYVPFELNDPTSGLDYSIKDGHYLVLTGTVSWQDQVDMKLYMYKGDILVGIDDFSIFMGERPVISFSDPVLTSRPLTTARTYAGGNMETPIQLEYYIDPYSENRVDEVSVVNVTPGGVGSLDVLGFSVYTSSTQSCDICLDSSPALGTLGTYQVEVMVKDTIGLTSTDVFTLEVWQRAYLPMALRVYPPVPTLTGVDNPDGDGSYSIHWTEPGDGGFSYEVQYSINDPTFSNPGSDSAYGTSHYDFLITPGTHYWRARVYDFSGKTYPWSNVLAVSVGNFSYLNVQTLCAFGLRIRISGPVTDSKDYSADCGSTYYWRSVPAGTYSTRLTWLGGSIVENTGSQYLAPGTAYYIDPSDYPNSQWKAY